MKLLEILNTMVMIGLASMMYNVHTYYTSFFDKKNRNRSDKEIKFK